MSCLVNRVVSRKDVGTLPRLIRREGTGVKKISANTPQLWSLRLFVPRGVLMHARPVIMRRKVQQKGPISETLLHFLFQNDSQTKILK